VLAALVLCAGAVVAMTAYAGYKRVEPVYVYSSGGTGYAYGNLSDTRNSADATQYISCYVALYLTQTGSMGSASYGCQAENASGVSLSCYGTDPTVAQYISSGLKGDSYIYFSNNQNGYCTYIEIDQSSTIAPKGP
jgi:hypothetical protein